MNGWSEERVERLIKLWNEGLSASQVAKALGGVTRSAVIGKIHRLGLPQRSADAQRAASRIARGNWQPRVVSKPRPAPRPRRVTTTIAMSPSVAEPIPAHIALAPQDHAKPDAFAPLPGSKPRLLIDRPRGSCTWPVGEDKDGQMLVCCQPVAGRWCEAHDALNRARAPKTSSANELARGLRRYV